MTSQFQIGVHRMYWIFVCLIAVYIQLSKFAHSESTNSCVNLNIVLILPTSSDSTNFEYLKRFIGTTFLQFYIDGNSAKLQISEVKYRGTAVLESTFSQYSNLTNLLNVVQQMVPVSGTGNNTAAALALANHAFRDSAVRGGIQNVVILFLDGPSDDPAATYNQALLLKQANVTIIAVALTNNVDQVELKRVPTEISYVLNVSNYGDILSQDIAFLTLLCSLGKSGTCPAGFFNLTGTSGCYKLILEGLNWDQARQRCEDVFPNSRLAVIQNEAQNSAITSYLNGLTTNQTVPCHMNSLRDGFSFYLGAQRIIPGDCSTPLVWKLVDNVSMPLKYTDWYPGEPNCVVFPGTPHESCLHTWNLDNYTWNDLTCNWTACAICQFADKSDCLSSPCQNNGTCVELISGYFCGCLPNYSGDLCEIDNRGCSSSPCQNAGTCIELITGYYCSCQMNDSGEYCEISTEKALQCSNTNESQVVPNLGLVIGLCLGIPMLIWPAVIIFICYYIKRQSGSKNSNAADTSVPMSTNTPPSGLVYETLETDGKHAKNHEYQELDQKTRETN